MTEVIDPSKSTSAPMPLPAILSDNQEQIPKKPRKPKKKMSEHHKAKCVESLKKAREASAIKRKEKAEYKKIMKKKEQDEITDVINTSRAKDKERSDEKDAIILRLKKQLDNLTLNDVVAKPKRKMKKMETIIELSDIVPPPMVEKPVAVIKKPDAVIVKPIVTPVIISNKPKPYICKRKNNKASKYF